MAGAILYGQLNGYNAQAQLPTPEVAVRSFRVFPPTQSWDFDLWEVVDTIEARVPQIADIKVYNLSIGPEGPIMDEEVTRFTYALDRLSYFKDVQFCVAVGNDGQTAYPRIQSPSDAVNAVGVGAWTFAVDNLFPKKVRAPYSCTGAGREGAKVKPDVAAFGGCENHPFHVVSLEPGQRVLTMGTSFATPLVARQMAMVLGHAPELDPLTAKALVVHSAENPAGHPDYELGHGCIADSVTEILSCSPTRATAVFQGSVSPRRYVRLPVFLPDTVARFGREQEVVVNYTMATIVRPRGVDVDDYTCSALEDRFFPHSRKHRFVNSKTRQERKVDIGDKRLVGELTAGGWVDHGPVTAPCNEYRPEQDRRALDATWDTVVRRISPLRTAASYFQPYLELHFMEREDGQGDPVKYAVVVTAEVPGYPFDVYREVRQQWKSLVPIQIRTLNEIMVPVKVS